MREMKIGAKIGAIVILLVCLASPVCAEVGFGFKGGMFMPDQDPFKDQFDPNIILGGVLEFDSNMGVTVEADVEYYGQDGNSGGEVSLFPILVTAKYNFFPRYRTTPFVGLGIGAYFFDREYSNGTSKTKTKYGTRVVGGIRLLEDRRVNLVLEAARNFVDFDNMNASSFQFSLGLIFDLYPSEIGAP